MPNFNSKGFSKTNESHHTNFVFNKLPTWNRLFMAIAKKDKGIIKTSIWKESVELVNNYHQILGRYINPNLYMSKLNNFKGLPVCFFKLISGSIKKAITEHRVDRIIKRNLKKNFSHLIGNNLKNILLLLLQNDISEKDILNNVISKIHTIKDSDDLICRLENILNNKRNWFKDIYLDVAKTQNFSIIYENDSKLVIHIKSYKELLFFAPKTWCIVNNKESFLDYISDDDRFFMELDFSTYPNSKFSILGIIIDRDGNILDFHDTFNNEVKASDDSIKTYKKLKISDSDFISIILNHSYDFNEIGISTLKERRHLFSHILLESHLKGHTMAYIDSTDKFKQHGFMNCFDSDKAPNGGHFFIVDIGPAHRGIRDILDTDYELSSNTYNPLEKNELKDSFHIFYFLLSNDYPNELISYLDFMHSHNIIDIPRLVFSTNHEHVLKNNQSVIFEWAKKNLSNT